MSILFLLGYFCCFVLFCLFFVCVLFLDFCVVIFCGLFFGFLNQVPCMSHNCVFTPTANEMCHALRVRIKIKI